MKCQSLLLGKIRKSISESVLNFLPSMLSIHEASESTDKNMTAPFKDTYSLPLGWGGPS